MSDEHTYHFYIKSPPPGGSNPHEDVMIKPPHEDMKRMLSRSDSIFGCVVGHEETGLTVHIRVIFVYTENRYDSELWIRQIFCFPIKFQAHFTEFHRTGPWWALT